VRFGLPHHTVFSAVGLRSDNLGTPRHFSLLVCMTRGPECRSFSSIFFLASIFLDLPRRSASFRHPPRAVLLPRPMARHGGARVPTERVRFPCNPFSRGRSVDLISSSPVKLLLRRISCAHRFAICNFCCDGICSARRPGPRRDHQAALPAVRRHAGLVAAPTELLAFEEELDTGSLGSSMWSGRSSVAHTEPAAGARGARWCSEPAAGAL
jgi:hypothetical protein